MSSPSSDGLDEAEDVIPAWGTLAVEIYLLQKWDPTSSDSPDEQRQKLVRDYVQKGHRSDPATTKQATPAQIATIIRPWRSVAQRRLAIDPGQVGSVWLRTCYTYGSDAKHDALLANVDLDNAVDSEDRLLNDPALYNFGDDWANILDYVPELVTVADEAEHAAQIREAKAQFRAAQEHFRTDGATNVAGQPTALIENARRLLPPQDVEPLVLGAMQSSIHKACVTNYVIVEDAVTLADESEDGQVAMRFLDARGRVVREVRVSAGDAEQMGGLWLECAWDEGGDWAAAELGPEYRRGGSCGDLLLWEAGG